MNAFLFSSASLNKPLGFRLTAILLTSLSLNLACLEMFFFALTYGTFPFSGSNIKDT